MQRGVVKMKTKIGNIKHNFYVPSVSSLGRPRTPERSFQLNMPEP